MIGVVRSLTRVHRSSPVTISAWHSLVRSLTTVEKLDIRQGGNLVIDFSNSNSGEVRRVEVVSQWQDHCDISYDGDVSHEVDVEGQVLSVKEGSSPSSSSVVRVVTPETINVFVRGDTLDLKLQNKMEGDIHIACEKGAVRVDKIRGMSISFECGEASLESTKLVEGDTVNIVCGDFYGKMVNGENVSIKSGGPGGVSIKAVYANRFAITAASDVQIDLLNGESHVVSEHGTVKMANVDGAFNVEAREGNINLQVNKLMRGSSEHTVGGSRVTATKGGIQISVDPEVRATVDAQCFGVAGRAVVSMVSDSFEEYTQLTQEPGGIKLDPRAGHRQGLLTGDSAGAKRPNFLSTAGRSSGKINLAGAESQAMQQTMSMTKEKKRDSDVVSDNDDDASSATAAAAFDLTLRSHGHIRLETLSWIEIIRRKHGFGDDELGGLPPPGVGRTASSSLRVPSIVEEAEQIVGRKG